MAYADGFQTENAHVGSTREQHGLVFTLQNNENWSRPGEPLHHWVPDLPELCYPISRARFDSKKLWRVFNGYLYVETSSFNEAVGIGLRAKRKEFERMHPHA